MNVYEVHHDGHYLGGLSIVVAATEERAIELTRVAIAEHGCDPTKPVEVVRTLPVDKEHCFVLDNGDY